MADQLNINEVKKIAGLSRNAIYCQIKAGKFPKQTKVNGLSMWDRDEVLKCVSDKVAVKSNWTRKHRVKQFNRETADREFYFEWMMRAWV